MTPLKTLIAHCGPVHPLLQLAVPNAEFVELTRGYETRAGYPDLLGEWWGRGEAFAVVEHDVLPWPGALEELEACPEPWCGFSYYRSATERSVSGVVTLGCVRFGEAVLKLPNPLAEDGWPYNTFDRGWDYCDQRIDRVLKAAGFVWHRHSPMVLHAHGLEVW
jgi:hypothetical protein